MKLWIWWIAVVAVVSGPWFGVVAHPQWERVTWIPFAGFEDKPRDIAVNFLLYVPFGVSFAASRYGLRGVSRTVAAVIAISLAAEVPQLFFRLRDPSATDVLMAACGAAAGSLAAQAFDGRYASRAPRRRDARERCSHQ